MDIHLYLYYARKWGGLVLLPALVFGVLAYVLTSQQTKQYQAGATLYVQQASAAGAPGSTDINGSSLLAPTYSQMITNPVLAQSVDAALAARYPHYHLQPAQMSAQQQITQQQTQLVTVSVTDSNPQRAADAVNALAAAFIHRITSLQESRFAADERSLDQQVARAQANIKTITRKIANAGDNSGAIDGLKATLAAYQATYQQLLTSQEQFRATRDATLNGISIYAPASVPVNPVAPHPARMALTVFAAAILVLGALVYIWGYLDDHPRTPEEIEELAGAPILGTIQQFNFPGGEKLAVVAQPRSVVAEAYRLVRTNLQFANVDTPPRIIAITSPTPAEGKSTTASNLAHTLAESGRRVVVVDADLRRPSIHTIFGLERSKAGLTSMLVSRDQLNGHGQVQTRLPALQLIPSGPLPPNPVDLLQSERMRNVITHLTDEHDMVVIDTPPILSVADASIVATMADGVVLVVDPGQSTRREIRKSVETIQSVGGTLLGVVINKLSAHSSPQYYYYSQHYYANYGTYGSTPRSDGTGSSGPGIGSSGKRVLLEKAGESK